MGHPIIGDSVYGPRRMLVRLAKSDKSLFQVVNKATRQMLHAYHLTLTHPVAKKILKFETPLPEDMRDVIKGLRQLG